VHRVGSLTEDVRVGLFLLVPLSCSNVAISRLGDVQVILSIHLSDLLRGVGSVLLYTRLVDTPPHLLFPVGRLSEATRLDKDLDRRMQSSDGGCVQREFDPQQSVSIVRIEKGSLNTLHQSLRTFWVRLLVALGSVVVGVHSVVLLPPFQSTVRFPMG
jgi:hypothetical protein